MSTQALNAWGSWLNRCHPELLVGATFRERTRTSCADTVTEWVPVDRGADGHEEGER